MRLKTGSLTKDEEDENMKVIQEEKQGCLLRHTQTQTLISNVLLPGGEKQRETKSITPTETGGVVEAESPRGTNRKIDGEKQITHLTDDS